MKTSNCVCGQLLFFENTSCVACARPLGFLQDRMIVASLDTIEDGDFRPSLASPLNTSYCRCRNFESCNCNWMVPKTGSQEAFCISCRLNTLIPNLEVEKNQRLWSLIEAAKRRLVYSSLRLHLPLANRTDEPTTGLGFRFLADIVADGTIVHRVITEHDHGLITLNIEEADDSVRERMRLNMKEPYRTLLGHFRHETGHYYWDRLVWNTSFLEPFRNLFGDERMSYEEAMKTYYANGAPANWQNNYISAYSTMHPWEDWAETWAHYLHIQDCLEVASDFDLIGKRYKLEPVDPSKSTFMDKILPKQPFEKVLQKWADLTVALNSINRSMGLQDLYPFILSDTVGKKLHFIYDVIAQQMK